MEKASVWNQYPSVLPQDGERVLVKYSHSDNGAKGEPVIGIFQYDAKEDSFKNADSQALEKSAVNAWAPL